MERVKVAAIGTGGIFRGAHLPNYADIPQAQLVALCDSSADSIKAAQQRMTAVYLERITRAEETKDTATADRLKKDLDGVKTFADYHEMLAKEKLDLVDVCTQPFLHAPVSIAALEAGVNVMCEKPMARTWLECDKVIEAAKKSGKLYQHNENWLWDRDYYTAKKLIDAGVIGEPVMMFLATAHGGPEGNSNFWNSDIGGGGALLDNGIHAIGASWYLSGLDKKPVAVKAAAPFGISIRMPKRIINGRFQDVRVEDDGHILIRFENEDSGAWATAHVEGSWSHRDSPDTMVIGTTGTMRFTDFEGRRVVEMTDALGGIRRVEASGPTWQYWPSSFYGEILNMVECVRSGIPSISGPEFGADCSAVVGSAYLSEIRGRNTVRLGEFKQFALDIRKKHGESASEALVNELLNAVRNG